MSPTAALQNVLSAASTEDLALELRMRQQVTNKVQVYEGTVELSGHLGDDLTVVNAARVSFGKMKSSFDEKDEKLISYLAKHHHMSPFRHVLFQFRLENIPEFTCRQLYKHNIGMAYTGSDFHNAFNAWNEVSGRYIELDPAFHTPESFRKQSASNKQASLEGVYIDDHHDASARDAYQTALDTSYAAYQSLLAFGVCKEQARMVLPVSFLNHLVWTCSLEAVAHFVKLRDHDGAQLEIRKLAQAIHTLVEPIVPISLAALLKKGTNSD